MNTNNPYLSADEVIQLLDINKATLYSYVSRGLIRSEEENRATRNRRYLAEDVQRLLMRKETRRNPSHAAAGALHFGEPVLESAITLIENDQLFYRGLDATLLAKQRSFEEVAAWIWRADFTVEGLFNNVRLPIDVRSLLESLNLRQYRVRSVDRFQVMLPLAAAADLAAFHLTPEAVANTGARILALMTCLVSGKEEIAPIAQQLQRVWAVESHLAEFHLEEGEVVRMLDAALVLCADHELNASSFTARCVAGAGSTPYAVVLAGLAALQGVRHGGHTERVESLFQDAARDVKGAVLARLQRGEPIPGFGHPLYPKGDPRAQTILQLLLRRNGLSQRVNEKVEMIQALAEIVWESSGLQPNLDFALVALSHYLALPAGAPLTLFALGRTAGWIGHAIEQYQSGQMIRPRARYVGNRP